jgi:hypothetical protein
MGELARAMAENFSRLVELFGWPGAIAILSASGLFVVLFGWLTHRAARSAAARMRSRPVGFVVGGLAACLLGSLLGVVGFALILAVVTGGSFAGEGVSTVRVLGLGALVGAALGPIAALLRSLPKPAGEPTTAEKP